VNTILLDISTWDYVTDASGNWAMASEPYALAQDVSSAIRLVKGELWYDTTQGIPYLGLNGNNGTVLGLNPSVSVLQGYFVQAALSVPGVVSATAVIQSFSATTRQVTGQVQFTDSSGNTGLVSI
jgi:hypothetical protein